MAIILILVVLITAGFVLLFEGRENDLGNMGNLTLKSSAFKEGDTIPRKFTCDGENVNPLLEIKDTPTGTKSFVLIVDDPDATNGKTWDHWVMWNIDPKTQYIMEDNLPSGAVQGINSWNKNKYGGPCPPQGAKPHRYMFKLYALDAALDLATSSTAADVERAMANHVIEKTTLMGLYGR